MAASMPASEKEVKDRVGGSIAIFPENNPAMSTESVRIVKV